MFPARSVHEPAAALLAPSVLTICVTVADTGPETTSVQLHVSSTGAFAHPFALATGVRDTTVIAGALVSILSVADAVPVLPVLSRHVADTTTELRSPTEVPVAGQVAALRPDPPASVQFRSPSPRRCALTEARIAALTVLVTAAAQQVTAAIAARPAEG